MSARPDETIRDTTPMAAGTVTRDLLRALGHAVEWHEYPIGHTVSVEELEALRRWVLGVMAD